MLAALGAEVFPGLRGFQAQLIPLVSAFLAITCDVSAPGPEPNLGFNIGALIIRIGFGGILYYKYNKETPKTLF